MPNRIQVKYIYYYYHICITLYILCASSGEISRWHVADPLVKSSLGKQFSGLAMLKVYDRRVSSSVWQKINCEFLFFFYHTFYQYSYPYQGTRVSRSYRIFRVRGKRNVEKQISRATAVACGHHVRITKPTKCKYCVDTDYHLPTKVCHVAPRGMGRGASISTFWRPW